MKDLLVASVFANSQRNETWLGLQRDFLQWSTSSFDHAVYLNHCPWSDSFRASIIIGRRSEKIRTEPAKGSADHAIGLTAVFDYFKEHKDYSFYLILDSDCFPVRRNWLPALVQQMKSCHFAAPMRSENFEDYPHPCALFLTKESLDRAWTFAITPHSNRLGKKFVDLGCGLPTEGWFPLLRTNVYNPHPIFAAIYKHYFYHHGAGSRRPDFRNQSYYDHIKDHARVEAEIYGRLKTDPWKFVSELMGGDALEPGPTFTMPAPRAAAEQE
ncbi:MAG TPA: hypothetical protein VKI17_07990 [Gemmataceae bacterium]|nr:hypothetical protein [Gemmataceae bacterium]